MSATPGTTAGGATPATVSDVYQSDMAVTKIANTQKDTEAATATDNVPPPVSHPIDPNAPSLLNLPGEVRNAIYEALFIREDPIQIHAKNINRLGYHSGYRSESIISGTTHLQSCRQIQHEATGVLYARHVFRLVLPASTDDEDGLIWAMDWLRIIGKQSAYLRVIQLDISNFLAGRRDLEILPILEYTWKPEHENMAVSFVIPPESLSVGFVANRRWPANLFLIPSIGRGWSAKRTAKMNKGLSALIADPSDLLRKYWITNMLLRVKLDGNGLRAYVSYRHNHLEGGNWMTKGRISISNGGELRVTPLDRNPGLHELMTIHSVKRRLFDLVQPPEMELVFDLTNQTTNKTIENLARLNRWLHRETLLEVRGHNSTFTSTTSKPKYNFETELETFAAIQLRGRPRHFHLYFDLSEHFTLEDVRFDALPLISALSSFDCEVNLKIAVRHPLDSETSNQTVTMLLRELKVGVFSFIYNFLNDYPNRAYLPCPKIWTNGFGQAKEAIWQDELWLEPVDNSYPDNSQSMFRQIRDEVTNEWASRDRSRVGPAIEGTLFEFLGEEHGW